MALSSYYPNYGEVDFSSSELMMKPPPTSFKQDNPFDFSAPTQLQPHCFSNYDDFFFDPSTYQNYPTDCFLSQEVENPLLDSFITLEDYEFSNRLTKRQKCYNEDDNCYHSNNNDLMSSYYYMEPPLIHGYALEPPPLMVRPPPQYFQESSCSVLSNDNKSCNSSRKRESSVTAQSIAARQRRKKISEKTVELSKLVPGGSSKMNSTAEMLHGAFKYVKFMQAQVGILQAMSSFQEVNGSSDSEPKEEGIGEKNLEELVTSGKIQDKLSSMEKCLVPINFVKELAKDESFSSVSDSIIKKLLVSD